MSHGDTSLAFLALKSFGDLIIQQHALLAVEPDERRTPLTLIGEHLLPLYGALDSHLPAAVLPHRESGVPAIYDVRKYGISRALKSALSLRRLLATVPESKGRTFVVDHVGVRERFLTAHNSLVPLGPSVNIYRAYRDFLGLHGFTLKSRNARPAALPSAIASRTIGIFPGSRIAAKSLPSEVIRKLFDRLQRAGFAVRGFALEGEALPSDVSTWFVLVPRSFEAMRSAIRSVDFVISADSMPAHLAEFDSIPPFVLTPKPNEYWMPLSAFERHHWQTFESFSSDERPLRAAIDETSA